jgi:hypothetical protein
MIIIRTEGQPEGESQVKQAKRSIYENMDVRHPEHYKQNYEYVSVGVPSTDYCFSVRSGIYES